MKVSECVSENASAKQTKLKIGEDVVCVDPILHDHVLKTQIQKLNGLAFKVYILNDYYFSEIFLLKEPRWQPAKAIGSIRYREKWLRNLISTIQTWLRWFDDVKTFI